MSLESFYEVISYQPI